MVYYIFIIIAGRAALFLNDDKLKRTGIETESQNLSGCIFFCCSFKTEPTSGQAFRKNFSSPFLPDFFRRKKSLWCIFADLFLNRDFGTTLNKRVRIFWVKIFGFGETKKNWLQQFFVEQKFFCPVVLTWKNIKEGINWLN